MRLVRLFVEMYSLTRLTRVGLRHVNIIPFAREDGLIPLDYFFTLGKPLLEILPGGLENFSTAFVAQKQEGRSTITVRIDTVRPIGGGQEALKLDFDFAMSSGDLQARLVERYLTEAHGASNDIFGRLIAQTYHDYIEGEEI